MAVGIAVGFTVGKATNKNVQYVDTSNIAQWLALSTDTDLLGWQMEKQLVSQSEGL